MSACLGLEQSGRWRVVAVAVLFLCAAAPLWPLARLLLTGSDETAIGQGFTSALRNSVIVAFPVVAGTWILGLPAGVLAALYDFPARRFLLALATLPLVVPSFLWAIGWSSLVHRVAPTGSDLLGGYAGCVLVYMSISLPLTWLAAYASTLSLSRSQVEAARLAGGERVVIGYACRHAAMITGLVAILAGVLTVSDLGPGQIFGLRTASGEILTSFSALFDFRLAALQCFFLAGVVLLAGGPISIAAAPFVASQLLARQTAPLRRISAIPGRAAAVGFTALIILAILLPLAGLAWPLLEGKANFPVASGYVKRTIGDTLFYAAGAGLIATALGMALALSVGRRRLLLIASLALCLALVALPPSLPALGYKYLSNAAPPSLDFLLRSRATVCLALGVRFFPVAALLCLRAWMTMPPSWAQVAAIHGVPLHRYLLRVVLPHLLPTATVCMLLVGLLATADVATVHMLHPPGNESLPLSVFTVMANAPEGLVATLCLLYVAAAAAVLMTVWIVSGRRVQ